MAADGSKSGLVECLERGCGFQEHWPLASGHPSKRGRAKLPLNRIIRSRSVRNGKVVQQRLPLSIRHLQNSLVDLFLVVQPQCQSPTDVRNPLEQIQVRPHRESLSEEILRGILNPAIAAVAHQPMGAMKMRDSKVLGAGLK